MNVLHGRVLARRDGRPYRPLPFGSEAAERRPLRRGISARRDSAGPPRGRRPSASRCTWEGRRSAGRAAAGERRRGRGRPGRYARGDRAARREGMLGVEADAQPLAPARLGREPPELLEAPADLRPLSGRVLERDGGGEAAAGLQHLAERARRRAETRILARAAIRARMRDQVRDAEALAALELGDQLAHRTRAQRCDRRRRVGQVGVVREQRPDAGRRARRREGAHVLLGERAQRPLPRRAREDLDRLAAERPPALEGAMEPARDRLMRAEERAGAKWRRECISTGQAAPWLQAPVPELKLAWGRGGDATRGNPSGATLLQSRGSTGSLSSAS